MTEAAQPGIASIDYVTWLADHERAGSAIPLERRRAAAQLANPAHVTVFVAAMPDGSVSRTTLDSILLQTWGAWDVQLMGRRPTPAALDRLLAVQIHVPPTLKDESTLDSVVRINHTMAPNDLVVFLPADVQLRPEALFHVAVAASGDPLCDLLYWDDDVASNSGPTDPRFRPSWSPEMLLSTFYLGSSFAVRSRLLTAHGLRGDADEAAWWDLILRADIQPERVIRIPRVLSRLARRDDALTDNRLRVLREHTAARFGDSAVVERSGDVGRIRWRLTTWPSVTVIIPTRHNRDLITAALSSIARSAYPDVSVIVVDNGDGTDANRAWYAENPWRLNLKVIWWTSPFNYSAVNNAAAREAGGEVLVFLNDDTCSTSTGWLEELAGWAVQPAIGEVGTHLRGLDGRLRHGGVIVGLNGFADHLFAGAVPPGATMLGPLTCYRNVSAVTAACVAMRRTAFEEAGGFDERFELCGSDVALGLELHGRGYRNLCTPHGDMTHVESATRGAYVPPQDFAVSYWRYQVMLHAGDPFFSPNLSLTSTVPELRPPHAPTTLDHLAEPLGRVFSTFRQAVDLVEARNMASRLVATRGTRETVQAMHRQNADPFTVETVNWFLPGLDSPFYGGWNTILRIVDHLEADHGVSNRLITDDRGPEGFVRAAITAAFPRLQSVPIRCTPDVVRSLDEHPLPADVGIATLWTTAYSAVATTGLRRLFYLIQDFEPLFYPAGTMYALAEESYRLGLYGICNTENLLRIYADDYGGAGMYFQPAVDRSVFHPRGREKLRLGEPVTLVVYARPGHWRNCWEMATEAIAKAKTRLGDRLRVVTAGSWASDSEDLEEATNMRHLGLLEYRASGVLYRSAEIGLALTVSAHPSYLPLEMMACGAAVVAFDNPAGHWLLKSGENCLLTEMNSHAIADAIVRLAEDAELRRRLSESGLRTIDEHHSNWPQALSGIYDFLCDPEGQAMSVGPSQMPRITSTN